MKSKQVSSRNQISTKVLEPLVVDLCCGMGGISLAAKQLGMQVLVGLDINPAATRTFENNFPDAATLTGSVRSGALIEDCKNQIKKVKKGYQPTIVVSGPPCQGFSVAGSRDPNDPRNQILLGVARFIAAVRPRCALIENVARILDDNHSARLKKMTKVLVENGFHVNQIVLDAKDYGVAQRRKRAFFLITRRTIDRRRMEMLFQSKRLKPKTVKEVLNGLPQPKVRPDQYFDSEDNGKFTNHFAMQHSEKVKKKILAIPQGTGPMSYRKLHPKRASNTLISGHRAPPAHYSQPRSITVREAMRLQGFPDAFRVYGPFGSQMQQVSNAVPPPLAKVALEVLCEIAGVNLDGQ